MRKRRGLRVRIGLGQRGAGRGAGLGGLLALLGLISGSLGGAGCAVLPTLRGPPPALEPAPKALVPAEGVDLRGVVHCHSELSHDSEGTPDEIIAAAQACGVRFVAMTDHFTPQGVNEGLRGHHGGVLFMTGAELSRAGGSVLALGIPEARTPTPGAVPVRTLGKNVYESLPAVRAAGGLAVIGHAEGFQAWDQERNADALEIVNLHAHAKEHPVRAVLGTLFAPPGVLFGWLLAEPIERVLARWDALLAVRRLPALGGCDAHANVRLFGPLGGTVGTYEESFRSVTTHVEAPTLSARAVLSALAEGRGFVAVELSGDASGFRFDLVEREGPGRPARRVASQGGEAWFREGLTLSVRSPGGERVRIRMLRDGMAQAEVGGGVLDVEPTTPGVYRVEVLLDGGMFVLSNAIRILARQP